MLLLVAIPLVRPLGFLERRSMDFRSNLRRILDTPPLDDRILIVDIDDYSLDTIKSRWPWNRRLIATAITNLSTAGAKVIGVDLMFLNESQEDPEQDTVLADAIRKAGNVILISAPYVESEELFSKTIQPFDGLKKAAMGTAFTACLPDDDNVVRKMFVTNPHIANPLEAGGFTLWLEHATRYGTAPGEHDFKRRFPLLPTDSFGLLPINFHYRYQRLSIAHVINWEFHSGQVKEKVIFIGTSTALTHDLHTSTRGLIPGVDLQAYTLSTLLDESFLRRLPWWGEGVLLLVAGIAATLLIPRMTAWRGLTAVAGSVLLWYGLATGLIFTNTVLPVVRLTTMLLSLYVLLLADRYIFTLKENVKLYRDLAQKHRMEHEVDIAREIQQSMYPSVFPTLDGRISIEARSLPARELGGDYFDFFPMDDPDSLGIVVADVSGKGLNAALVVSLLKGFLKALVQAGSSPTHVLEETNQFVNTEL
ncbi:MAG: CHASE2 domain-containing protein, partial [bacterium]|nr:CHASE2 domain-containing protein [bacterium]